jgi:hypothetical protein
MTAEALVSRMRRFMLLLTALIFLATLTELWLVEHANEPLQFVPIILCGLGLVVVAVGLLWPQKSTLLALRVVMIFVALGGLVGIGVHLSNNLSFEQEIRPNAAAIDSLIRAFKGAAPLLAPGVLVFAALLAFVATYSHPALGRQTPDDRLL